ncbi:hypothetical protein FKR81_27650 [Lentzea tibetensis]|uniref:Ig-like domain-containing protein n=1 Tax=Lentzea tibetensis TaxID=2591470 RepID=A0A563EN67_9PSEU|nr:hypothetical protein [Lentzea tibetensis]TWP48699.1 hypothetical protein FKR81_27650 [Lentzea tibetensis]
MSRRRFTVTATVVVALLVPAIPAAAADTPAIVVCHGVTTTTFDPPLTPTPQAVDRTTTEELLCEPVSGMPFTGSRTAKVRATLSCPALAEAPGPQTFRYTWDTLHPPNFSVIKSYGYPGDLRTSRAGVVISGRYKNYSYIQVTDTAPPSCASNGIAETTTRSTATFLSP